MLKSGDKVICFDDSGFNILKRAKIYTVDKVYFDDEKISLIESPNCKYNDHRFIPYSKNPFRVGDKVVLIDDSGNIGLKKGNVYTVSECYNYLDKYDEHNTDIILYGNNSHFCTDRFVSLKEYRKQKFIKINNI